MTFVIEQSILATFVLPIAQALRMQGCDAMELIESVGIDPAGIINPDRRVPLQTMHNLMKKSVEATGDEAFGLLAAEQLQPQVLHGLGLAWLASDTVYDGLKRTVRFCRLMSTGVGMQLFEDEEYVHLVITRFSELKNFDYAACDFSVGIVARMARLAMGEFISPVRIEMQRPVPKNPAVFESILSSHIVFDCEETRLTFYRRDITVPLATGDPVLARVNDLHAQSYLDTFLAQSTSKAVVAKIVELLPDGPPSQQQIAEILNLSNRTLQRKLKTEDTSFMELLRDTRMRLARDYLQQPAKSVVETSYLLGFSEPSTFSRAFKRWTGQAPVDFRENTVLEGT